ncbi:hypothetical protein, partial [Pseudomonas syringae]|uniref:hypothetical protein n=1 Tax=Pseudomonas syringae TaxID=317 RepID=UPI001F15A627
PTYQSGKLSLMNSLLTCSASNGAQSCGRGVKEACATDDSMVSKGLYLKVNMVDTANGFVNSQYDKDPTACT